MRKEKLKVGKENGRKIKIKHRVQDIL